MKYYYYYHLTAPSCLSHVKSATGTKGLRKLYDLTLLNLRYLAALRVSTAGYSVMLYDILQKPLSYETVSENLCFRYFTYLSSIASFALSPSSFHLFETCPCIEWQVLCMGFPFLFILLFFFPPRQQQSSLSETDSIVQTNAKSVRFGTGVINSIRSLHQTERPRVAIDRS